MSQNKLKTTTDQYKHEWHAYAYTAIIFLNYTTVGINSNIFGPAMVDMTYIYGVELDLISLWSTFLCGGFVIGSLCGLLYNYFNRQLLVIILVVIASIASSLVIFCNSLALFYLCFAMIGVGCGAALCANNVWLFELWPKNSGAALQFANCLYGVGAILSSLMIAPYLTGDDEHSNDGSNTIISTFRFDNNTRIIDRRSLLKFPLILNGILTAIGPILLIVMFFLKKYEHNNDYNTKSDEKIMSGSESNNKISSKLIITLLSIIIALYGTFEYSYFVFSATFNQYNKYQLSATKSAEIFTVFTVAFTVGRALSSLVALKFKPQHMLIFHFCLILLSLVLMIFIQTSVPFLWINNILLGYGCSAVYAIIYSFAENYVRITNNVGTIFTFFTNLLPMFPPFVLGLLIESNPLSLIYFELICLLIFVPTTAILLYYTRKQ